MSHPLRLKRLRRVASSFVLISAWFANPASAQAPEETVPAPEAPQFEWRSGLQPIDDGIATVDLGERYRLLGPQDARRVLEELWGNPPDPSVLGLVFPSDLGPLDAGVWAVVITHAKDGYVDDADAAEIDYDELLETMQADTEAASAQRKEAGYPGIELLGWAEPPHYDATTKKLYWAKSLLFEGETSPTLNYDVRILGRKGALVYSAVAAVDQLPLVDAGCRELLAATSYTEGNRYEDFDPSLDTVAAYGIGGLIAGKVLAKAGLLKVLVGFLKVGLKPILLGLVAVGAILFRRKKQAAPPAA